MHCYCKLVPAGCCSHFPSHHPTAVSFPVNFGNFHVTDGGLFAIVAAHCPGRNLLRAAYHRQVHRPVQRGQVAVLVVADVAAVVHLAQQELRPDVDATLHVVDGGFFGKKSRKKEMR